MRWLPSHTSLFDLRLLLEQTVAALFAARGLSACLDRRNKRKAAVGFVTV